MTAPMLSRIYDHRGSLGSNTTHEVPRDGLSSRNGTSRRTGTCFHRGCWSKPSSVGAPGDETGDGEVEQAVRAQRA